MYYYKARYYDPETGRFLQTDPIGYEDQMNLYAYVYNDPVNNFDPTGLKACPADAPNCIDDPDSETEGEEQVITAEQEKIDEIVVTAKRKKKLGDTPIDFDLEFPDEQYFRVNPDGSVEAVDGKETVEFYCPSGDKSSTVLNRGDFAGASAGGHTHPNWAAGGPGPDDGVLPGALGVTGYVITPTGVIAVEKTSVGYRARLVDGRWGTSKRNVQRRVRDWNQNAGRSGEKCVRK